MRRVATALRRAAFTVMALFGVLGALFIAGETFTDPGDWAAVGMVAAWSVPMVGLMVYAVVRKTKAAHVFVAVAVALAGLTLVDQMAGTVPRDDLGPVVAVGVFSLGFALGFLGLYRPTLAGALMVALAVVQLAAVVLGQVVRGGLGDGLPIGAVMSGSSGVVVVPLLVAGALFLAAGSLVHEPLWPRHPARTRPAH